MPTAVAARPTPLSSSADDLAAQLRSRKHVPLDPATATAAYRARFWSKVEYHGADECWEWTRATVHGYGRVAWADGKTRNANRVAYALAIGDPGAIHVLHHCDNPPCCNPAHLFLGTDGDNVADMCAKGRHVPARRHANDVHKVHQLAAIGESQRAISRQTGVSRASVQRIIHGRHWTSVSPSERNECRN